MLEHVTPSRARRLLSDHGLRARRSLGQHFLVDPNTVRRIVRLAEVQPGETILEIGPGLGSLTVGLAEAGAQVVALELDAALAGILADVVGGAAVRIVIADAMTADLAAVCGGPARLVSNLPYNLATPILARVLDDVPEVTGGLVMVQRELGERWTAGPGGRVYGAISVKVAFHAQARIVGDVPRTVFLPPPKVSSVLVAFQRLSVPPVEVDDPASFLAFVAGVFGHRRKTVRNALRAAGTDGDAVERALDMAALDPAVRPERLDLDTFARLYGALRA